MRENLLLLNFHFRLWLGLSPFTKPTFTTLKILIKVLCFITSHQSVRRAEKDEKRKSWGIHFLSSGNFPICWGWWGRAVRLEQSLLTKACLPETAWRFCQDKYHCGFHLHLFHKICVQFSVLLLLLCAFSDSLRHFRSTIQRDAKFK